MNLNEFNILVLAYLGDTIYENYIRHYLISLGMNHVDDLQKRSISFVSASSQVSFLLKMQECSFFTDEERNIILRARNYKNHSHPKNCDLMTYKYATGLEALIGYLELSDRRNRIDEIMKFIIGDDLFVSIW